MFVTGTRIKMHFLCFTDQVAGRSTHVLTLPLVHVRPDHVTVGTVELGIDIEKRLDIVIASRDLAEAAYRKSQRRIIDNRRFIWVRRAHVYSEHHHIIAEARFGLVVFADEKEYPARHRRRMDRGWEENIESRLPYQRLLGTGC